MHYLTSTHPYKARKHIWLQNEHTRTFSNKLPVCELDEKDDKEFMTEKIVMLFQ